MKKNLLILPLLTLLITSCVNSYTPSESSSESESPTLSESESSSESESPTLSESESSSESESESSSESESESEYVPLTPAEGDINFYAINDFHGTVLENGYEMGIQRVGSFLKEKGSEENTILINSGDFWQGSLQSNYSYGKMLTEISNEIEFDSFTIGNHEFDWGEDKIVSNRKLKNEETGHQTPFLAANIYDYDINTKEVGEQASYLGDEYTIVELENGIRVGIIGLIGQQQITSITSQYVDHLTFLSPYTVAKELATELREQKGCHVVVASIHDGSGVVSSKFAEFIDAFFVSHTHRKESLTVGGKPVIQGGYNGRYISNIKLHLNLDGSIDVISKQNLQNADIPTNVEDEGISNIIDKYKEGYEELENIDLGYVESYAGKNDEIPNMVCTAFADYAYEKNIDIDYAVCNSARDGISSGNLNYSSLFKALPFDNEVFIAEVSGYDLKTQLGYNNFYRVDNESFDVTKTYTIAVIDYLATHRNNNREYDKYPSLKIIDTFKSEGTDLYNYRDVTKDWLLDLKENNINVDPNDFTTDYIRHNEYNLETAISNDIGQSEYIF